MSQNMYIESMHLTSATFPAAMTNLIPAITFVLAVIFGLELLHLKSLGGKLKIGGTVLGIGGAMVLTFYRGFELPIWSWDVLHIEPNLKHVSGITPLGAILSIGSCVSYSIWLIIQAKLGKSYPCYSSTALIVSMASIQSTGFALCTVRDWSQWKLGWNVRLFSVIYSGVFATGVMMILTSWCVNVRGPLFASVFSPLGLVLVALTGSILLNEKLHIGWVIGGVLIAIGLYFVLWGKARELKRLARLIPVTNSTDEAQKEASTYNVNDDNNQNSEAQSEASTSNANDDNHHDTIRNGEEVV